MLVEDEVGVSTEGDFRFTWQIDGLLTIVG